MTTSTSSETSSLKRFAGASSGNSPGESTGDSKDSSLDQAQGFAPAATFGPLAPITSDFMTTLQEAETTHHPTTIAALFSPNASLRVMTPLMPNASGQSPTSSSSTSLSSAVTPGTAQTPEEFWRRYLSAFRDIGTQFTHVIESRADTSKSGKATIEWVTRGTLTNAQIVKYNGVTVLEHDGEVITTLRVYFDSAALLPEAPRTMHSHSYSVGMPEIGAQISS